MLKQNNTILTPTVDDIRDKENAFFGSRELLLSLDVGQINTSQEYEKQHKPQESITSVSNKTRTNTEEKEDNDAQIRPIHAERTDEVSWYRWKSLYE